MAINDQSQPTQKKGLGRKHFKGIKRVRPARDFWIFLAFLGVSILFWCIQTLNGYTLLTVSYGIRIVNLPSERIVTSYIPETIQVSLSGRGFMMLSELFSDTQPIVAVDYSSLPKNGECAVIDLSTWRKILQKVLAEGVTVSAVSNSPMEIYTAVGKYKQVLVVPRLRTNVAKNHVLLSAELTPKYVNLYAPAEIYDTISAVYTEQRMFRELNDTIETVVAIEPMRGVKVVPDSVRVRLCVDLMTSQSIKVPVTVQNVPDGYVVKTFPHEATVSFNISSSMYGNISTDDFMLAIDYNMLKRSDQWCEITLQNAPEGISSVSINPAQVEYIVEQCKR